MTTRIIDAEVLPPDSPAPRSRRVNRMGGLGQGGDYSYRMPSGQIVTMSWPQGGPVSVQDEIVAWIEENPMLAVVIAFVIGIFVRPKHL